MEQIKKFYNRYWRNEHIKINPFDNRPTEWTEENFNFHLKFFKPFIQGRVLDFGCGDGQFLYMISKYCDSVYGIDVSEIAIQTACDNYSFIEFKVLSEDGKMPYPDEYFDTICAIDVLEHILDVESVLEEINRVLKPKGNFLITTSQLTRIKLLLVSLFAFNSYFYPTSPHIRYFTKWNLGDILMRKGFKIIRYKKNRTYLWFIPQGQMVVAQKIAR